MSDKKKKSAADQLTVKQRRFAEEYLKDTNATKAYQRAGYSAKKESTAHVNSSRLLHTAKVQAYIQELMDERSHRTAIDADYVLRGIKEATERCMQHKPVMEYDKGLQEYVPTGEYEFDSRGAFKGYELLGKHLKLFTDQHEVQHSGNVRVNFNIPRPKTEQSENDE